MNFNQLLISIICLVTINIHAQNWQNLGAAQFSAGTVEYMSSAMNSVGTPYVAFQDMANSSKTTVMKYDGMSWGIVGSAGFSAGTARWQSIAIDNSGTPYVAYQDLANNSNITVMKFGGTNWTVVGTVGFSTASAQHLSLAIDNNGTPYVAFKEGVFVRVMKFDGINWVYVGTNVSSGLAEYPSLVIDNLGALLVAYIDVANSLKATVMQFNGATWVTVGSAAFSVGSVDHIHLTVDNLGTPYIGYSDAANGAKATVMTYDGSSWVLVGTAGFSSGGIASMSLSIDNGMPYVAYSDIGAIYKTKAMKFNGSNWVTLGDPSTLANGWGFAHHMNVFNGVLYVSYQDGNKTSVITYNTVLGVENILDANTTDFMIMPNPVQGVLNISTKDNIQQINILNVNGQLLKSVAENNVSVTELPQGVYIVELITNRGVSYKEFVLSK